MLCKRNITIKTAGIQDSQCEWCSFSLIVFSLESPFTSIVKKEKAHDSKSFSGR